MPNAFSSLFSTRFGVYEVEYLGGGAGHAALLSGESFFSSFFLHTLCTFKFDLHVRICCTLRVCNCFKKYIFNVFGLTRSKDAP